MTLYLYFLGSLIRQRQMDKFLWRIPPYAAPISNQYLINQSRYILFHFMNKVSWFLYIFTSLCFFFLLWQRNNCSESRYVYIFFVLCWLWILSSLFNTLREKFFKNHTPTTTFKIGNLTNKTKKNLLLLESYIRFSCSLIKW